MSRQATPFTKLGALLRSQRMTMGKLSAITGINYITLSKYVNAHKPILPQHAFKIADAFGVKPDEVYGMVDE